MDIIKIKDVASERMNTSTIIRARLLWFYSSSQAAIQSRSTEKLRSTSHVTVEQAKEAATLVQICEMLLSYILIYESRPILDYGKRTKEGGETERKTDQR
jgi:hypothetical protein